MGRSNSPLPGLRQVPRRRGGQACRQITQAIPETKVIVFTAMDDPDLRQRSLEVGASAFVCKLAGDGDLLATINRLCADPID